MRENKYATVSQVKKLYKTDLTDTEWKLIEPLIPPSRPGGRPRKVNLSKKDNKWDILSTENSLFMGNAT